MTGKDAMPHPPRFSRRRLLHRPPDSYEPIEVPASLCDWVREKLARGCALSDVMEQVGRIAAVIDGELRHDCLVTRIRRLCRRCERLVCPCPDLQSPPRKPRP